MRGPSRPLKAAAVAKKHDQALIELKEVADKNVGRLVQYYSKGHVNNYGRVLRSALDWDMRTVWVFIEDVQEPSMFPRKISIEQIRVWAVTEGGSN
jgi:hypothetical protein